MAEGGETAAAVLALLARRAPDATVCPSEVARVLAPDGAWRAAMPAVHAAVDRLAAAGAVRLRWKGAALAERDGPYRIAQATPEQHGNKAGDGPTVPPKFTQGNT